MGEKFHRADEVRAAARGRWVELLSRFCDASLLTSRHGPCPGCGGRDRFRFDDKDGEGTFICSQGGGGNLAGDGLALVQHVKGCDWREAANLVGEALGLDGRTLNSERRTLNEGVVRKPERARESWVPGYDVKRLREAVRAVPGEVDAAWFMRRSPVDVGSIRGPGDFLERVFLPGERVLVFTRFRSQGDFLWEVGKGGFRLADERGVKAVRSALPRDGGRDGVWFLNNPVDGQWHINPRQGGKYSRRSEEAVTSWRYVVLENDEAKRLRGEARETRERGDAARAAELNAEADEAVRLWWRFLARAPVGVRAIYSSGGESWHALVVVDCATKADFDGLMRGGEGVGPGMKRVLPVFGADPAAMTGVRLTRLPGCTRKGMLQRLIYLDPGAGVKVRETIQGKREVR